jgi:A/G-specific adenine glycosylase
MILSPSRITAFRRRIFRFYRTHRRSFAFRETTDPYKIAVSEFMLQQTQIARVLPKYDAWITRWPDWSALAEADNRELLSMWSGLGYNRRALYLGQLAKAIVDDYDSRMPDDETTLRKLPGIGPYTARAVLIFAFNRPIITIDTNVRRVLIHELGLAPTISAHDLEHVAMQVLPRRRSRDWHYALMDYSSLVLPRRLPAVPPTSKQSRFEGSLRQIRGEIVRRLTTKKSVRISTIARLLSRDDSDVLAAALALSRENVITIRGNILRLR